MILLKSLANIIKRLELCEKLFKINHLEAFSELNILRENTKEILAKIGQVILNLKSSEDAALIPRRNPRALVQQDILLDSPRDVRHKVWRNLATTMSWRKCDKWISAREGASAFRPRGLHFIRPVELAYLLC